MPKGAKKRAKLKKKQQQGHPDDGANNSHHPNGNGSASDNNASSHLVADHHHLRIPPKASRADTSEDSMESSEEMVTPRAAASEADEERKAASEVPVERAVEVVQGEGAGAPEAGEDVMVDALPPEAGEQEGEGKVDAEVEVHAVVQEPEVKDVVVATEAPAVQEPGVVEAPAVQEPEAAEAPAVQEPEGKREGLAAKVHPVHEPELKVQDVVVVSETPVSAVVHEPEVKGDGVVAVETVSAPVVPEPDTKNDNVVVKNSAQVSRSLEAADVHTTETARGPAVAVAAAGQRATWWNCCGLFDVFSGSER
ncbi:hypothetical protein ACP70R_038127 [Stipagrostis hirtigluma subsp. patula]